jgi:hypothetical protein
VEILGNCSHGKRTKYNSDHTCLSTSFILGKSSFLFGNICITQVSGEEYSPCWNFRLERMSGKRDNCQEAPVTAAKTSIPKHRKKFFKHS